MYRKTRLLSGALALLMCLPLAACGTTNYTGEETVPAAAAAVATPAPTPVPARSGRGDAADKEETVYIEAAADGTPRKVTVETVLNYAGNGGRIPDRTDLTNIRNTEGDEEFEFDRDGTLMWEDHGEPIRYEGESDADLPVTVHLTYWLDGVETDPADLAGKSGHLRVRFDYVNQTERTVTVTHADLSDEDEEAPAPPETEEIASPIPFIAISLAMLPEETFRNVTAENGRLVSLGDSAVVIGYAFPGLQEALDLTASELTEELEIPDFVEFEADVTDLTLDFTATILQNGLLDELETGDLDDLEKLTDGMDKLAKAVDELADGTRELSDGAEELSDGADTFSGYIAQYVDGAAQAGAGAKALSDALSAMDAQTGPLKKAADAASGELSVLRGQLAGYDIPGMDDTAAALEALIGGIDTLQSELTAMMAYPAAVQASVAAADVALSSAMPDTGAVLDGIDLTDEQRAAVQSAVSAALSGTQGAIDTARGYLAQIPDAAADPALAGYIESLSAGAARLRTQAEEALTKLDQLPESPNAALDDLGALLTGVSALCNAIGQVDAGAAALSDGMAALTAGGSALKTAASALAEGAGALHDGTVELADGVAEFRDEGISELTDKFGGDLADLVTRVRALREADLSYDSFAGLADGRTGSVRFIVETDAIE